MPATVQAILLVAAAGLAGSLLASILLLLPRSIRDASLPMLLAFAVGALTGAAFFELLPHAFRELDGQDFQVVGPTFFLTLLAAFLLEKFLRWRQGLRSGLRALPAGPAGPLVLVSDAVHKFVDGLLVVAAFLTDPYLGATTALAVVAHEIPQELSILAILLSNGVGRLSAFLLKLLSSSAVIAGGVAALLWLGPMAAVRPYVLVAAAALFTYVALGSLVPELQRKHAGTRHGSRRQALIQVAAMLAGAAAIFSLHHLAH